MFGFGASSSNQQSTNSSQSSSFGESSSENQNTAVSNAVSANSGSAVAGSSNVASVFGDDVLKMLFGNASKAAGAVSTDALSSAAGSLFDSGQGFLANLQKLSSGPQANAGTDYLTNRVNDGGSLVDQQISALQNDLGSFFQEQIMPSIRSDAVAAGGVGGSREGVAQGAAATGLFKQFVQGSVALRTADQQAKDAAAGQLTQAGTQSVGQQIAAATGGTSALPGTYGLADAGAMAGLSPYLALSQILGQPTVLNNASSFSQSQEQGGSVATSAAQGSGSSSSSQGSQSSSEGQSTASSHSFNVGVGG